MRNEDIAPLFAQLGYELRTLMIEDFDKKPPKGPIRDFCRAGLDRVFRAINLSQRRVGERYPNLKAANPAA